MWSFLGATSILKRTLLQVRNVFQQRSRWTKGHYQIFFQPKYCPLFQHQLSIWMRLMYSTGIWSYVVCAICTPFFLVSLPRLCARIRAASF